MSEVARNEENNGLASIAPAQLPQTESVVQLQDWAAELAAARQLGQALAMSNFLPMSLQKKGKDVWKTKEELANDAAAVILAGKSVGLDPMQSVQNIFPVHGMPSMYARTMGALVIAAGHEVKRIEATDDVATYAVRRKGDKDWQEFTWTIQRATKAGYTGNAKYKSDPIAMLSAKAEAEACRTVFPDVLLGMAYSAEEIELEDMGETKPQPSESASSRLAAAATESAEPAKPAKAQKGTQQAAKPEPKPEPEPVADKETGEIKAEPEPETKPKPEPMATMAQRRKIGSLLEADGYTTKEDMLDVMRTWADRDISGSKELTKAEAELFITKFEKAGKADDAPATDADQAWMEGASA